MNYRKLPPDPLTQPPHRLMVTYEQRELLSFTPMPRWAAYYEFGTSVLSHETNLIMNVTTEDGRKIKLTEEEAKVLRAVKRLSNMEFGRLHLFGASGWLSVRFEGRGKQNDIFNFGGQISGGDGSDYF